MYLQEPSGKSEQAVRQREGKYFQKISQKNTLNAAYICTRISLTLSFKPAGFDPAFLSDTND